MLSIVSKLEKIRDAMNLVSTRVYHYKRPGKGDSTYIVWQEDGSTEGLWADGRTAEQQLHGTVDLYTLTEYDPLIDEVQEALNSVMGGWSLQMVDYEDTTNLIHYEWEWTI